MFVSPPPRYRGDGNWLEQDILTAKTRKIAVLTFSPNTFRDQRLQMTDYEEIWKKQNRMER